MEKDVEIGYLGNEIQRGVIEIMINHWLIGLSFGSRDASLSVDNVSLSLIATINFEKGEA